MELHEIVDEQYLRYRVRTNEYIGEQLTALGVPIVRPVDGHAVFIDARRFLPHIPALHYPGRRWRSRSSSTAALHGEVRTNQLATLSERTLSVLHWPPYVLSHDQGCG